VYAPPPPVYVAPPPPVYVVPRRAYYRPAPVYVQRPVVLRPASIVVPASREWRGHRDEYGTYQNGRWNDERRYKH